MIVRHVMDRRLLDRERNRQYIMIKGKPTEAQAISEDLDAKAGTLITERGSEESVRVVKRNIRAVMPWRFSTDLPRAAFVTLLAGIGYLL